MFVCVFVCVSFFVLLPLPPPPTTPPTCLFVRIPGGSCVPVGLPPPSRTTVLLRCSAQFYHTTVRTPGTARLLEVRPKPSLVCLGLCAFVCFRAFNRVSRTWSFLHRAVVAIRILSLSADRDMGDRNRSVRCMCVKGATLIGII